jgi:hypothetical protein
VGNKPGATQELPAKFLIDCLGAHPSIGEVYPEDFTVVTTWNLFVHLLLPPI